MWGHATTRTPHNHQEGEAIFTEQSKVGEVTEVRTRPGISSFSRKELSGKDEVKGTVLRPVC